MIDDDLWLTRAVEAWSKDIERTAYYVVPGSAGTLSRPASSRFPPRESADKICERCGLKMRLAAVLELSDVPELGVREAPGVTIRICPATECRGELLSALAGKWGTFIHSFRGDRQVGRAPVPWLSVVAAPSRSSKTRHTTRCHWFIEPDSDVQDPMDFGWYERVLHRVREADKSSPADWWIPGEHTSHAQAVLSRIDDRVQRHRVYERLVSRRRRWHDAKFGGYPHWRSMQIDGGCECSMRGTPVFTFSPSLCPSLCAPRTSAWLLMCKEHPLEHTGMLVFQSALSEAQLGGPASDGARFALKGA